MSMEVAVGGGDPFKRPAMPPSQSLVPSKKGRFEQQGAVVAQPDVRRTSNLQAPIMLLSGHEGEIYASQFSPDGTCFASAGFDMKVFLWNVYGDCENFSMLKGHTGAVMDLHFGSDSSYLCTASTDKTVRVWDMETGACTRRFKSHTDIVNACHPARRGPMLVASASDDGTVMVYDVRRRDPVKTFKVDAGFQQTAVSFSDTAEQVIAGGIDNDVRVWDMRRDEVSFVMRGHTDTITGMSLSPDGSHLLTNAMDCTARIWDVRPFAPVERCIKVLNGHQHNFEKNLLKCAWSPDSHKVTCGSSDRYVYVWEVSSRKILYKLPGHQGSVNTTAFHPKEPILLSAGSDKRIYLGELDF